MIYLITKYHKTEAGETASSVDIKDKDPNKAYKKALSEFYTLCKNYTDDPTVLAWKLKLISAFDMTEKKTDGYAEPIIEQPVEKQPTE